MEEIWKKWEEHYRENGRNVDCIRKDGIIGLEEKNFCGIMFILREPNRLYDNGKGFKDLRELYRSRPYGIIGRTLARWAYGVLNQFPAHTEVKSIKDETLHQFLKRTAVINLKKNDGQQTSDLSVINAYAYCDRDLLLEQIKVIKPRLIIACGTNTGGLGTFDSLVWLLDLEIDPDKPWKSAAKARTMPIWVIPSRHPSNDPHPEVTYDQLIARVKGIREDLNLH